MRSILLVDGNRLAREGLAVTLRKELSCVVLEGKDPAEALEILEKEEISLLITDLFPRREGIELLKKVHQNHSQVVTIASVPSQERESVVEVLRLGTFFTINSPYDLGEAVIGAARGMRYHDLLVHKEIRGHKIRKSDGFYGIIGKSPKMQSLFTMVEKVAEDGISTVLVQGESGTGKELVARAIHAHSPRRGKNFVPVNCAAIPDELLESELFGYVKGAFTGATQSKMGRIQYSDGGTLFLDEIGDMKPALQAKLLRVLQEKEFEPVGGLKPVPIDTRIIAATHRDLEKAVAEGKFREDLYYRLSVVPLSIPPLRERKEDIPQLIEKFVQVFNRNKKPGLQGFKLDAMAAITEYPWPGNVRELENLVQRMVILHSGEAVGMADLPAKYRAHMGDIMPPPPTIAAAPPEVRWEEGGIDFNNLISEFEDQLILQALSLTKGNKKEAAKLLNLKRTTLIEKIKKKGLDALEEKMAG